MILKNVQIQDFKCIEDSEVFNLKQMNCLVGKNEAGKSAVLQALYKLNPVVEIEGRFDPLIEYPRRKWSEYKERHSTAPANVLTTEWELTDNDIEPLVTKFEINVLANNNIILTKGYNNQLYWQIKMDESLVILKYLESLKLSDEESSDLKTSKTLQELINKLKAVPTRSDQQTALLDKLNKIYPKGELLKEVEKFLATRLPKFVYFADYDKMIGTVSIDDLRKRMQENRLQMSHRIFMALLNLVGTKPDEIDRIGKFEELVAELEAVSSRLSEEIFQYWSQNKYLEVEFRFDFARPQDPAPLNSGYIFRTRIKNTRHGVTVGFDERSTGFVWFFSFLIWFSQVKKNYGENLVLLFDDPGLSLHARAQADLLRYMNERLGPNYQVIYTTHSPFMIDPDNLLGVKTVEDVITEEGEILGTKIGDDVLSTDPDTVFPLQAHLGYDIAQTLFIGKHTLLVEGPSDLLYLKWFSKELKEKGRKYLDPRWIISVCGGISKVASFVTLFSGKKLHLAVLTDYHTGLKKQVRSLRESELLKAGHVFSAEMYAGQDEADIEDLLGWSFYIELVNLSYSLTGSQRMPIDKPTKGTARVLVNVEERFKSICTEFDHYTPSVYLTENSDKIKKSLPEMNEALDKFERLFIDLNHLLEIKN